MAAPKNATKTNRVLEMALEYLALGWSVIPLRPTHTPDECRDDKDKTKEHVCPGKTRAGSKKPAIETWEEYKTRRPTETEVREWFTDHPDRGIAAICGTVSA